MSRFVRTLALLPVLALGFAVPAAAEPSGTITWAAHVTLASRWLDPGETDAEITPFMVMYALHDALVKPMPAGINTPCLAESWSMSKDGRTWDFVLRKGVKFHNGDPVTAEDVKFTFQRYKGASAKLLHDRVKSVDVLDPLRIQFVLDKPWPDFLQFYATPATGAAWIVPRKYIEKVGEDGFRRQPVGLGPYRVVRQTTGVELVLEANEQYWRKKPSIKTIIIKGVPDRTTRLAMLKTGEADIGYLMVGVEASTIKADSKLRLARVIPPATWWLDFPEQFNPKSPWHDRRVRLAATMAVDKQALNEAERLGFSRLTGSIIPSVMEFALRIEPYPYDPTHAKRLLVEAGYPNGFDAGEITPLPPFVTMGESVANYLGAVGIRGRVRSMERATYMEAWRTKTRTGVFVTVTAAPGNAASRIENFVISSAPYATGGHPDIDDLFRQQAQERDRKKRETLLHQIQRLMYDRVMYGGIFEPATLHGIGPRVEEPGVGLSPQLYFTSPWEDMRVKKP